MKRMQNYGMYNGLMNGIDEIAEEIVEAVEGYRNESNAMAVMFMRGLVESGEMSAEEIGLVWVKVCEKIAEVNAWRAVNGYELICQSPM